MLVAALALLASGCAASREETLAFDLRGEIKDGPSPRAAERLMRFESAGLRWQILKERSAVVEVEGPEERQRAVKATN